MADTLIAVGRHVLTIPSLENKNIAFNITNPTEGQMLCFDQASQAWKNTDTLGDLAAALVAINGE